MHISNVNILKKTDKTNIAIAKKYQVAYGLSIGILKFDLGPC